jgi:hypothetical protein
VRTRLLLAAGVNGSMLPSSVPGAGGNLTRGFREEPTGIMARRARASNAATSSGPASAAATLLAAAAAVMLAL